MTVVINFSFFFSPINMRISMNFRRTWELHILAKYIYIIDALVQRILLSPLSRIRMVSWWWGQLVMDVLVNKYGNGDA
jgi:hypothetical protein